MLISPFKSFFGDFSYQTYPISRACNTVGTLGTGVCDYISKVYTGSTQTYLICITFSTIRYHSYSQWRTAGLVMDYSEIRKFNFNTSLTKLDAWKNFIIKC